MTALAAVPQPSLRAGIYGRLSTAKDAGDYQHNVETPVQRQFHEQLAHARRQGWTVVRDYPDDGYSGWTGARRPGFEQLIEDVNAGLLDVVSCWKIDRLSRHHGDFQRLWEACQAHGTRIASATEPIDSSDSMGEFIIRLLVGMAKMYSDQISEGSRTTSSSPSAPLSATAGSGTGAGARSAGRPTGPPRLPRKWLTPSRLRAY